MPGSRRTLSVDRLRTHLRQSAFHPGPADRVGVEVELTPLALVEGRIDLDAARAGVDGLWSDLSGSSRTGSFAWRGGVLSREPGGQVEFSGAPSNTPDAAARATVAAVRALRALARRHRSELIAVGLHPWASADAIGLRTSSPRYASMQAYFDSIGPYGRRMMRQTGSIQVAVDHGSGAGRWELAQRLSPILAATFANSAVLHGRPSPSSGLRAGAWLRLDPTRTGIPPRFLDDPRSDPVDQYLDFALDARVMFVVRPDGAHEVCREPLSFRAWMRDGDPHGHPDQADWETHLSTLFPDVRPQGYLELRSIDAPGLAWLGVPILIAGHALREPEARRELLDLLRPYHDQLPSLRDRAARLGLADPTLSGLAESVFRSVRPRLGRAGAFLVDTYLDRYIHRGWTPGDELRDRIFGEAPLDPTALLRLERERLMASRRSRASSPIS